MPKHKASVIEDSNVIQVSRHDKDTKHNETVDKPSETESSSHTMTPQTSQAKKDLPKKTKHSFSATDRATRRVIAPYVKVVRRASKVAKTEKEEESSPFGYYTNKKPSQLLHNLSLFLSDSVNLASILQESGEVLKLATQASDVTIYLVESAAGILYNSTKQQSLDCHRIKWKIETGSTIAAYVAFVKEYVLTDDVLGDPRFPKGTGYKAQAMAEHFQRIILDVDVGIDDAFALLAFVYGAKQGKVKIEAITLCHGNGPLAEISKNTIRLLEILHHTHVPVYAGAYEPLILSDTPFISTHFGTDGFCNIEHKKEPNLDLIQKKVAAIAMNDIVTQNPGQISLICLAPLTNVALAMKLYSSFTTNIKKIFIFGGNFEAKGNTPNSAEFNFYVDPEAAQIVLRSAKCPVTIMAYETVINHPMEAEWRFNEFANIKSPLMTLLNEAEARIRKHKLFMIDKWTPFDLYLAVTTLFPEVITESRKIHVSVELSGTLTRGQMVLDHRQRKSPNAVIITKIDVENLKRIVFDILQSLE